MILLDTSALFALTDGGDKDHGKARELFALALSQGEKLVLHNYILLEAAAIIQRRLGLKQTKKVLAQVKKLHIFWVDSSLHTAAEDYFHKYATRKLSLVDCVSFVMMKQYTITTAFAFDKDFPKAGFQLYQ